MGELEGARIESYSSGIDVLEANWKLELEGSGGGAFQAIGSKRKVGDLKSFLAEPALVALVAARGRSPGGAFQAVSRAREGRG